MQPKPETKKPGGKMKVCLFGTYDPLYARNRVLRKAMQKQGIETVECNSPLPAFEGKVEDKLSHINFLLKTSWEKLKTYSYLTLRFWRNGRDCDAIFVLFPWEWDVPLARVFSFFTRQPVAFDVFVSKYNTFVLDSRIFPEKSFQARWQKFKDTFSCSLADTVLIQTEAQKKVFIELLGVERKKLKTVYLGAEDDLFFPRPEPKNKSFNVLFFGSFVPLQGAHHIIRAIKLLENEKDIRFRLIGTGQTYRECMKLAEDLGIKRTTFAGWVDYEFIPREIAKADLCLGQFGESFKGSLFIGHKVFQAMAMQKPIINGDYAAAKEHLKHRENIFLCKTADEKALADAILLLKKNPALRKKIAFNAFKTFNERFSTEHIGKELKNVFSQLLKGN